MSEELIGKVLNNNFRVERLLGQGGMAQVYYGMDIGLNRPVAIKVIDERWRNDETYTSRFVSEAQVVATWRHDNIVQVYFAGKDDDVYFFAMEYIDGLALDNVMEHYVQSGEFMPHEDVVKIGRSIASGLDYGHQKGVIHRDIKPANIMVDRDDRVIITDFGLALDVSKGTVGEIFGTPHYIAPEQAVSSANAVAQSDLYALGVILFEMLTGVVPFDDESITALALQHITKPVPSPQSINPRLNDETEKVLLKALEKEPAERYQSGAELIEALENALFPQASAPAPSVPVMPSNVKPPSQRSMSHMSVSERIALELDAKTTPGPITPPSTPAPQPNVPAPAAISKPQQPQQPPPPSAVSPPKPPSRSNTMSTTPVSPPADETAKPSGSNRGMIVIGVVIGVIILVGAVAFGIVRSNNNNANATATAAAVALANETATGAALVAQAAATEEPTPTDEPTATEEATDVPPTATDMPSTATDVPPTATDMPPTATDAPPTATDMPSTATNVPPTATPMPPTATPVPVTPTDAPPTVLYPTGRRVQIMYNPSSLYIWNGSDSRIRNSRFAFEALDASGTPLGLYRFQGNNWSRFYSFLDGGRCVAIEATGNSNPLRPPQCGSQYNSLVNFMQDENEMFWLSRGGLVVQFRVLWDGSEIARCEVNEPECEFRVPSS